MSAKRGRPQIDPERVELRRRPAQLGSIDLSACRIGRRSMHELIARRSRDPIDGRPRRWAWGGGSGAAFLPVQALGCAGWFDRDFAPRPAIGEVMRILDPISACGLAAFFESTSSFLNGRRPRELLATDPEAVIAAAMHRREVEDFCG